MGRRRRGVDRTPGAGSGALPEAIAALSRALSAGPSPETFRRAKFDRPEAAPALWQLLFRVLSPTTQAGAKASQGPEAQVRFVKAALRCQGYPRPALAQLPEDGSQGSRELLLALAWLLARGPLLEQLLARTRVRLGDEMTVCECEDVAYDGASVGLPALCVEPNLHVDIRHVQWLMGKLRLRWRNLVSSQQEQCALLSKGGGAALPAWLVPRQVHLYTRGCHSERSLGHLSATETELLRDPDGSRQLLQALEQENARLEAAVQWRRRELIFWQWMVRGRSQDPAWSTTWRAVRQAVDLELVALQGAWDRSGTPAQPHGPHRLVRSESGALAGRGLWAAEAIRALRSKEACLEVALRQLQGQCRQELARLVGTLSGFIWIPPPGR
ncbi:tubulin epsilon and delta complex protein 1 isoform X4 [Dasypus novemcinctus]|uniref:tubulin epsilon and delta complex protein 1 isoform X4 n=1 Tax=Dasypus novemcinctus TaxID=9361 RepID=UPI0039C91B06